MSEETAAGMVRQRAITCNRVSRIVTLAEAELTRVWLPEAAKARVRKAFADLQGVCAAFGGEGRDET